MLSEYKSLETIGIFDHCGRNIYLRNKETQQTLQIIVSIQYDANF